MKCTHLLVVAGLALSSMESAEAQLFNQFEGLRETARLENASGLSGDRRFLRQNRRRGDFVGRTTDGTVGFVGQTQGRAEGRVQTAVETLREVPQLQVNVPLPPVSQNGLYEPRLRVGFETPPPREREEHRQLQAIVSRAVGLKHRGEIQVSLVDGAATLRGVVDSSAASDLAELVAQFEPGVSSVRNELVVQELPVPPAPAL